MRVTLIMIGAILLVALIWLWSNSAALQPRLASQQEASEQRGPEPSVTERAAPKPAQTSPSAYRGKTADLPQPAQGVLHFVASDSGGYSVAENVEEFCGGDDEQYMGSDSFPGEIMVQDGSLGASIVTWALPCPRDSERVVLRFRISHDGSLVSILSATEGSGLGGDLPFTFVQTVQGT